MFLTHHWVEWVKASTQRTRIDLFERVILRGRWVGLEAGVLPFSVPATMGIKFLLSNE